MRALLDKAHMDEATELLDHEQWATLRWYAKENSRNPPEAYGPFPTPAAALECADVITRQQANAPLGRHYVARYGEPVVDVVPLYLDYDD
jgi:hypothetical protein